MRPQGSLLVPRTRAGAVALVVLCLLLITSFVSCFLQPVPKSSLDCAGQRHSNPSSIIGTSRSHLSATTRSTIPDLVSYAAYWDRLLLEEHEHQAKELRERQSKWSRSRLEELGIAILDAFAEPDSEVLGEKIVRIIKPRDAWVNLKEKFSRGDMLLLTCLRTDLDVLPKECLVIDVGRGWLTVSTGPAWPKGLWESRKLPESYPVRMDRTAPEASLIAQRSALQQVLKGHGGKVVNHLIQSMEAAGQYTRSDGWSKMPGKTQKSQRHALPDIERRAGNQHSSSDDDGHDSDPIDATSKQQQQWKDALEKAIEQTSFRPNESQKQAIVWSLQRNLSSIRGPPGTGKTRVAALMISTYLKFHEMQHSNGTSNSSKRVTSRDEKQADSADGRNGGGNNERNTGSGGDGDDADSMPRVLAVTHSNGAADVLLSALLQMGVPAVRVGRPASVHPSVQHRTIVALAERHPELKRIRKDARDMGIPANVRATAEHETKQRLQDIQTSILQIAPVVVASCIGAHQIVEQRLSDLSFPLVVLDEAAQTTEPALVCALAAAKAEQMVMVGDTQQLPPTISASHLRKSLGVSPMSRLEKAGLGQRTLAMQYRMAPALLEHPSKYFYNGIVKCAQETVDAAIRPPKGFPWPKRGREHLAFVQVGPDMEITHSFGGKSNTAEAVLVTRIVQNLVTANDVEAKHIAVISPYAKQVQKVRSQLALHRLSDVRVGTVDSFQGQETEVVIISAVRSNMFGELGFLRDSRRLCVAITRAKRGLILVGDEPVLRGSHHWGALLDAIRERNCVIDARDLDPYVRNEGAGKEGAMMTEKEEESHDDDASADGLTGEQREAAKTNEGNNTADSKANMEAAVAQALAELLNDDAENEDSESEEELFGLFEKL